MRIIVSGNLRHEKRHNATVTEIHHEYQLQPGRNRQVWFIPSADERGVCR